jgi:transcriptional regulator with XRE-family HTH domain
MRPYSAFAKLLHRHRTARRWSMQRLGDAAGMNHSLISLLENDQRQPTRHATACLCSGLGLNVNERDELYLAAGYVPPDTDITMLGRVLRNLPRTTAPSAP